MVGKIEQLDLIPAGKHDHLHRRPGAKDETFFKLVPYWRSKLVDYMHDVFEFRHNRNTAAWSMTGDGYLFANWLLRENCMTPQQHQRWIRFFERQRRWDEAGDDCGIPRIGKKY